MDDIKAQFVDSISMVLHGTFARQLEDGFVDDAEIASILKHINRELSFLDLTEGEYLKSVSSN